MKEKKYVPLFLDLENRKCLVVGGGQIALRKTEFLLGYGARVTVVSPKVIKYLEDKAKKNVIEIKRRGFVPSDLDGVHVAIASTNDHKVNKEVSAECSKRGIICNVVDQPDLCTAIIPSVFRRGALQIAISTGGASPAMAKWIRKRLEGVFGDEYALALEILQALRDMLQEGRVVQRKEILSRLIDSDLLGLCKMKDAKKIDALLKTIVGKHASLESLEVSV